MSATQARVSIVFFSDANYEYQIDNLIQSIDLQCGQAVRLLYYMIGFESTITRPNLVKIPWPVDSHKSRMEFYKPEIILDALRRFGGHVLFFDSDIMVGRRFDPQTLVHDYDYPMLSVGNWDSPFNFVDRTNPAFPKFVVEDRVAIPSYDIAGPIVQVLPESESYVVMTDQGIKQTVKQIDLQPRILLDHNKLSRFFGIRGGTMSYVSTCFLSCNPACADTLLEWKSVVENQYFLAKKEEWLPFHDETALNVVLWRRKARHNYGRIFLNTINADAMMEVERRDDITAVNLFDNVLQHVDDASKVQFYHGLKDKIEAKKALNHLQQQGKLPHFMQLIDNTYVLSTQQRPEVFEYFRRAFEGIQIARILEIGTAEGGLTLGLRELFPSAEIRTIDIIEHPWFKDLFATHNIQYQCDGAWNAPEWGNWIRQAGISLVLCDGATKIAEFNHFAPILKSGDILLAHDYAGYPEHLSWGCVETNDGDTQNCRDTYHLVPFRPEILGTVVWLSTIKQ